MFTEFYRVEPNDGHTSNVINLRIAKLKNEVGDDSVKTTVERDGAYLYIIVRYIAKEPISF